jgi:hypothetical protein
MHSASTSSRHIRFFEVAATVVFVCALITNANAQISGTPPPSPYGQGGGGNFGGGGHVTIIPNVPTPHGVECHVDQPPRGSYLRSCERAAWDCDTKTVSASCKTRQGAVISNIKFKTAPCIGDIANMDGTLHCSDAAPPGGSYTQSCEDIWVGTGVLNAKCRRSDGSWADPTSLSLASCGNDIENNNGSLSCKGS